MLIQKSDRGVNVRIEILASDSDVELETENFRYKLFASGLAHLLIGVIFCSHRVLENSITRLSEIIGDIYSDIGES